MFPEGDLLKHTDVCQQARIPEDYPGIMPEFNAGLKTKHLCLKTGLAYNTLKWGRRLATETVACSSSAN